MKEAPEQAGAQSVEPEAESVQIESLPAGTETLDLARLVLEGDYTVRQKKTLLRELRKMSPRHNRSLYMTVVVILGLVVLITVGWCFSLVTFLEKPASGIPASLIALGSTALGALAGLLAPSPPER